MRTLRYVPSIKALTSRVNPVAAALGGLTAAWIAIVVLSDDSSEGPAQRVAAMPQTTATFSSAPTASAAPTPSTSPTPELSPQAVIDAMPAPVVRKYRARLETTEASSKQYFYFADTLPDMPAYICLALAANGGGWQYRAGPTTLEASRLKDRLERYKMRSATKIDLESNHSRYDAKTYVHHLAMDDDELVQLSLKHLCPEMASVWQSIRPAVREFAETEAAQEAEDNYNSSNPMKVFDDGKFTVGNKPGMIQPGTYTIAGPLSDCYWERSSGNGTIIDNQFITNAPSGTRVTVRAGEGFTSNGCTEAGRWTRVG